MTMAKRQKKPTKKTKAEESTRCWCKRTAQAEGHGKEIADVKDLIQEIDIESPSYRDYNTYPSSPIHFR